jgi:hypothetical protein
LGYWSLEIGRHKGRTLGQLRTQELGYLGTEDRIELGSGDIAVAFYALLQVLDNLEGGLYAHIRCDEGLFEVIQHLVIHGRFAEDGLGELLEETLLGLGQTLIEGLTLFFLAFLNKVKKSHNFIVKSYEFRVKSFAGGAPAYHVFVSGFWRYGGKEIWRYGDMTIV